MTYVDGLPVTGPEHAAMASFTGRGFAGGISLGFHDELTGCAIGPIAGTLIELAMIASTSKNLH